MPRIRPFAPRKRKAAAAAEALAGHLDGAEGWAGRRTSARLASGARECVTYEGGERVVVRRGGASTVPTHEDEGGADGDVMDEGECDRACRDV